MGSLLVVTGPPGAGKSTLAEQLAVSMDPSALVEGDAFFRFLRTGAIGPWLAEADRQNTFVTRAAGAAAGGFVRDGVHTVYDGIIGPWFLDEFLTATGLPFLDYVVLLPPVATCVERVLTRKNHGFRDEAATRQMHDEFTRRGPADRHLVNVFDAASAVLATHVLEARQRGDLRYPAV